MITVQGHGDHGEVRELQMNRPPANALTLDLVDALTAAVTRAPEDGARAIVLSGRPGMFSGGLDIPQLLALDRSGIEHLWRRFYLLLHTLAASPIPVVAAITGHSPAGGAVLATFCDHRVMAEGDFRIGLNEVRVGIPLPLAILRAVVRLVGTRQAERLCVEGLLVKADEALRLGLVDELAPAERVVWQAVEWASALLELPPIALAYTRAEARADLVRIMKDGMESEVGVLVDNWFHEEAQACLHALVEKLAKRPS